MISPQLAKNILSEIYNNTYDTTSDREHYLIEDTYRKIECYPTRCEKIMANFAHHLPNNLESQITSLQSLFQDQ